MSLLALFPNKGGSSVAPFSPTDISGMQVWFKSTNVVGATPITKWLDQSGNGRDITFPIGRQPVLSVGTGPNGVDEVVYDANSGGDWLGNTSTFNSSVGFTAVFAFKGNATLFNPMLVNLVSNPSVVEARIQVVPSLVGYSQLTISIIGETTINIGVANYYSTYYQTQHYMIVEYNGAGADTAANYKVSINSTNMSIVTDTIPLSSLVGANSHGSNDGGALGYNPGGPHLEYIMYSAPLTNDERIGLNSYLALKYT